jgi:hypothetical protein
MRKTVIILAFAAAITGIHGQSKPKELLAAVLSASGECYYDRDSKTNRANVRTIFFKDDRVYTKKGKMDIQIGPSAVLHLSPYSSVRMSEISEMDKKTRITIALDEGHGYTKFTKPMTAGSQYVIKSPTLVAGVRGTEFILSAGADAKNKYEDSDIPSGVFVNHGKVAVSPVLRADDTVEIAPGEQITNVDNQVVKGVMEDFIKKKMALFKKLDVMREAQYKIMEREKNRQLELLEKVRNSVNIDGKSSSFEELKNKQNKLFPK